MIEAAESKVIGLAQTLDTVLVVKHKDHYTLVKSKEPSPLYRYVTELSETPGAIDDMLSKPGAILEGDKGLYWVIEIPSTTKARMFIVQALSNKPILEELTYHFGRFGADGNNVVAWAISVDGTVSFHKGEAK